MTSWPKNTGFKASPPSSWSIPPAKKSGARKGTLREDQPNSSSGLEATTSAPSPKSLRVPDDESLILSGGKNSARCANCDAQSDTLVSLE